MHIGTSWAHKINAYTIITTNCANNCKVLVPRIPPPKKKKKKKAIFVALACEIETVLFLKFRSSTHSLSSISICFVVTARFCKSEGKGDGRRLMIGIHGCSEYRHAVPPNRFSKQNIGKASKPNALCFGMLFLIISKCPLFKG